MCCMGEKTLQSKRLGITHQLQSCLYTSYVPSSPFSENALVYFYIVLKENAVGLRYIITFAIITFSSFLKWVINTLKILNL